MLDQNFLMVGGSGYWKSDGAGGITTNKPVTINSSMTGKFIPRNETAENLDSLVLASGEIAMATDRGQIRSGDGSAGGNIILDKALTSQQPGLTWVEFEPGDITLSAFNSAHLAYGNGFFLLYKGGYVYKSTDFRVWEEISISISSADNLNFINGAFFLSTTEMETEPDFVMFSTLYQSVDGVTWTEVTGVPKLLSVYHMDGVFIGVESQTNMTQTIYTRKIYSSTDFVTWTERLDLSVEGLIHLRAGGQSGLFYGYFEDRFYHSKDGETWGGITLGETSAILSIAVTGEYVYILMDDGDGLYRCNKDNPAIRSKILADTSNFTSMVAVGDQLIITDITDAPITGSSIIKISSDGVSWSSLTDYVGGAELLQLNSDFIACVHGGNLTEYKPVISFNQRYAENLKISRLMFGDYEFEGLILTSPDGSKFRLTVANNGTLSATAVV